MTNQLYICFWFANDATKACVDVTYFNAVLNSQACFIQLPITTMLLLVGIKQKQFQASSSSSHVYLQLQAK